MNFLIEFPLSDKLMQKYLYLVIKNIGYNDESGRKAVYDCLLKYFDVFSIDFIEKNVTI